ncbi:MAG: hypothetical protein FWE23_04240 [Chitinivibrionia bacterium]|jgi:flagellin-like hook-associated protein FlgL|nr:hypothetical protein [Chitinivibrionia bacterium]
MQRITMLSVSRQTQNVIHTKFAELSRLQQQQATGKLLNRPSDGPAQVSNALRLRTQLDKLEQSEASIHDGLAWMELTDTNMTSMISRIHRARELGLQADTDALSPAQRAYIADEIRELTNQMVNIMNQRYKGNYIFSGTHTNLPPVISVVSDRNEANVRGNRMFTFDTSSPIWDPTGGPNGIGAFPPVQILDPNGSSTPPFVAAGKIIPGSVEIVAGGQNMREGIDFRIDYMNGTIEMLPLRNVNGLLIHRDMGFTPPVDTLIDANGDEIDEDGNLVATGLSGLTPSFSNPLLAGNFTHGNVPGYPGNPGDNGGGLQVRMTRLDESKDFYGNNISTDRKIFRQIEEGVTVPINISTHDLRVNNDIDIFTSLIRLGQGIIHGNSSEINGAIAWLDQTMHNILSAQSTSGAIMNRLSTTLERNEIQQVEVDRLRSNVEDADYATTIMQFSVKQTVFNAALQSTARLMQMSLMDFLR